MQFFGRKMAVKCNPFAVVLGWCTKPGEGPEPRHTLLRHWYGQVSHEGYQSIINLLLLAPGLILQAIVLYHGDFPGQKSICLQIIFGGHQSMGLLEASPIWGLQDVCHVGTANTVSPSNPESDDLH